MIINNSTNNYTLSSYNMQQKVDIIHSIRIETLSEINLGALKSKILLNLFHL